MTRLAQQNGYILLPVVLAISMVAAIAYMMSHESATETQTVGSELEADRAQYVAEAGLNHALWQTAQQGCGPYTDLINAAFDNDQYSTSLTTGLGGTTAYNITVDQDNWIRNDNTTATHPGDAKLHIRYETGNIERPMARYDLSTIPANSSILSAKAWFYVNKAHAEGPVDIHAITADWTEADATWDSMGANIGSAVIATIPPQAVSGTWVSVNLTAQVQAWVNGQPNYGITLNSLSEGTHGEYASKESAQVPYLEVVAGTPPTGTATLQSVGTLASGVARTILRNDVGLHQQPQHDIHWQHDASLGVDAEIWDQQPDTNYGNEPVTWVSSASNGKARTLLKFDVSKIPARAKILQATLSLLRKSGSGAGQPVSAHRVLFNWKEHEVTWNSRQTGRNWGTAGGDYDTNPVATTPVGPSNQRYEWNIAPLVQGWVDGRYANNGVLLAAAVAGMPGEEFYTSDNADPTRRPSLSITYACACGVACVAPQGEGNLLLVVDYPSNLTANEQYKSDLFNDWGYTVTLINDGDDQATYDAALANNDVAYISEKITGSTLGNKLSSTSKGVVSEEGRQNAYQGISSDFANVTGDTIDIVDNNHYITAPFPTGALPIYDAPMDQLTAAATLATDLQTLANADGSPGLVLVDKGGVLADGTTPAPGRRVMLPLGREVDANFDWKQINNNGLLLVQRALQWGSGNDGSCTDGNFRDEFATATFSNSDGSESWSADWVEVDSSGSGPGTGKAVITGGELRLNGTPMVITNLATGETLYDPSVTREMDLSVYQSATLSFDFRTGSGVEAGEDGAVVEISADGGSNWTVLEDFISEGPSASGSRGYDVTPYLAANIQVRFRISAAYGGPSEYFYIDNVDIAASCTPPAPTLPIAHWKLDETSGTTAVDSEGGHDGTLTNGPTWTPGNVDGALAFDGADDYVDLTSDPELDDVFLGGATVTAWIFLDGWGENAYGRVLDKSSAISDNRDGWMIGTDGGSQSIAFAQGFTSVRGFWRPQNNSVNLNEWVHYAIVYDASSDTNDPVIYINGVAQSSVVEISPSGTIRSDASIPLRLGNHAQDTSRTIDGVIDDVRIYDQMLSASEIAELATVNTRVLFVVKDPTALSAEEATRQTLMEGWGFAVNLIDDDDTQASFDSAVAANDAAYVSQEAVAASVGTKLVNATIGVVNESKDLIDEFGFATGLGIGSGTPTLNVDFSHYITSVFSTNPVAPYAATEWYQIVNEPVASGVDAVGAWVNSPWTGKPALMAINQGAALTGGGTAAGRRVQIPWGSGQGATPVANASLSDDARTIMKRAIEWAAGAGDAGSGGGGSGGGGSCDGTYRDEFNARGWSGSDGTLDWSASSWAEVGESDGAASGDVQVRNDVSNYQLRIRDNDNGGEGVEREADLTGASTATLSFDYRRSGLDSSNDYVAVYASSTGTAGPWTELPAPRIAGGGSDASYQPYSRDISAFISANTAIRLRSSSNMGGQDVVWFDNIQIQCSP